MKEKGKRYHNEIRIKNQKGDMAKLVDATDLIGLSLGMETYQVITFKFRETLELKKWAILSQIRFSEEKKQEFRKR